MANTTRWRDTDNNTLDLIIKKFVNKNGKEFFEQGDSNKSKYKNVLIQEKLNKNQTINLNGRNIEFNYIQYRFDKISPDDSDNVLEEDRTVKNDGFIIAYNDGTKNNYIISKNTGAKSLLRCLLDYTKRGEIINNSSETSSDFFIWLISRVYLDANAMEVTLSSNTDESVLEIQSVIGFKGSTDDLLSTVTAKGDSVMNILSTLSFILESKALKQVKIRLQYAEHENIELKIGNNGTIDVDFDKYDGIYEDENNFLALSKLLLVVYIEIIPILKQWYSDDKDSGDWNNDKYREFLSNIAAELKGKVDAKINTLD